MLRMLFFVNLKNKNNKIKHADYVTFLKTLTVELTDPTENLALVMRFQDPFKGNSEGDSSMN